MDVMQAIKDRVICVLDKEETISKGGIHLVEFKSERQKCLYGTVISCGPECKDVKINDRIMLDNYQMQHFEVNNIKYEILREENILAIIVED